MIFIYIGCGGSGNSNNIDTNISNEINKSVQTPNHNVKDKRYTVLFESANDYNGTISQITYKNHDAIFNKIEIDDLDNQYILVNYDYNSEHISAVIKLDRDQNILWQYTISGDKSFYSFMDMKLFEEYLYIVGSESGKATLIKIDLNGNFKWERELDNKYENRFTGLKIIKDYIYVVGRTTSKNSKLDALVAKYSQSGDFIWDRVIGGLDDEEFYEIDMDSDGFLYCIGYSESSSRDITDGNHGGKDGLIVKIDQDGNIIYNRLFGGQKYDSFYSIKCDDIENGCYAVGTKSLLIKDRYIATGYLLKFDSNGEIVYDKIFKGSASSELQRIYLKDNFIYITGYTMSNSGDYSSIKDVNYKDAVVIKTDKKANVIDMKSFGYDLNEEFSSLAIDSQDKIYGAIDIIHGEYIKTYTPYLIKFNMR
jgi:hypothetical protein